MVSDTLLLKVNLLTLHSQILNLPFSNLVKMKLSQQFILDFVSRFLLPKRRLRIFNFIPKVGTVQKMLLEEAGEWEKILMMNKDKKKQEKKLIENFWHGLKLVWNLLVDNLLLKFLTDQKDSMVLLLRVTVLSNQQKHVLLMLLKSHSLFST